MGVSHPRGRGFEPSENLFFCFCFVLFFLFVSFVIAFVLLFCSLIYINLNLTRR